MGYAVATMKKQDALDAVARAAQAVPAIGAIAQTGSKEYPVLELSVKDGRSITVTPEYGDPSYAWGKGSETQPEFVLLRAGRIGIGHYAADKTRTYRVRNDDMLNEACMAKALAELAAEQIEDVKRRDTHDEQENTKRQLREYSQRRLHKATGEAFGGYTRSASVDAGDYALDLTVKDNGQVKIVIDNLPLDSVEELLKLLGHKTPLKSDV